jgi:chemotaxis protein CheY-P-specific phosphatase CheC
MKEENVKYDLKKISSMKVLFSKCMENARAVLSRWFKMEIELSVSDIVTMPFNEVPGLVGNIDEIIVAVLSRIMGEIDATQLFVYPREDAERLVNLALKRDMKNSISWDELDCSVLEETSNIIGSAFINAMVDEVNIKAIHEPPVFGRDMLGSIMQSVLVKYAQGSEEAMLVKSNFLTKDKNNTIHEPLKIYFFILPEKKCFNYLIKELEE